MERDDNEPGVEELDLKNDTGAVAVDRLMREAEEAVERVEAEHGVARKGERTAQVDQDDLDREMERLRREAAELRDKSLRTLAEFENFRKRTERERRDLHRYAASEPLRAFLDVVDNLERALAASGSLEDLKTGVDMILRQMHDVLRQQGVVEIAAEGEPFDPNVHEAVAREESAEVSEPRVSAELQKGYKLHERLLRPARVKVAVPPENGGGWDA
jgi:molecular chaperone GrpE